jgi:hypothetical protein
MEVCIFSTVNQIEADMVKNALDENKIDNYLKNGSANALGLGGWTVGVGGANLVFGDIKVMVKEEDKEKALEIVGILFGDDEKNDTTEFEEDKISSNDSENLNKTQEGYDTQNEIEEDIKNESPKFKEKKKSPKRKFLIFIGLVILVMTVFTIYINIPPQPKKDKIETITQYYYYEQFTIPRDEYNTIFQPSEWDLDSTKDYRKQLKSYNSKLLYSTANATKTDLFTLFTNSGYTPSETDDIIYDINLIGNMIFSVEYEEDKNYIKITYFEKL